MKRNLIIAPFASAAFLIVVGVSNAFAQYGSGACAPTCDVPTATCAPTYEAPSCDVPTCGAPSCEATCDVGYETGYCGTDCCNSCCVDLCGFITGTLNAVASPFKWILCGFTDGLYPDCGCAPVPKEEPCNPCNICGDYVGGCGDSCFSGGCSDCNNYAGQTAFYASQPQDAYASSVYDVEQYDSSPTRGSTQVPTLPINSGAQNRLSFNRVRNFNLPEVLGNQRVSSSIRSVGYEQKAQMHPERIQNVRNDQVRVASPKVKGQTTNRSHNIQDKANVRIVKEQLPKSSSATGRVFGTTRPIQ